MDNELKEIDCGGSCFGGEPGKSVCHKARRKTVRKRSVRCQACPKTLNPGDDIFECKWKYKNIFKVDRKYPNKSFSQEQVDTMVNNGFLQVFQNNIVMELT